jgi:nitrous oxidase accessory protein NosD
MVTYSGSTAPTEYADNIIIRNCKITARHRGIFLNYAANVDIYNNEFYINQPATGFTSSGIHAYVIKPGSTVKIYNNKINQLKTANATTTNPLRLRYSWNKNRDSR